jgi:hypothetical protein
MTRGLVVIAAVLGFAPLGPPAAAPSFRDPGCENEATAAKRQRCYFDTIARHPHLWKHRPDDPILQWHVDKAEAIFEEGVLRELAESLEYTRASENMFRTSMILVLDVKDPEAAPRNAEICRHARKALDRACKVTYCAHDEDTPAASASVGDSAEMARRMYHTACPDDWSGCPPTPNFSTPSYCKGIELVRKAVARSSQRFTQEEHKSKTLELLVPQARSASGTALSAWKHELVDLTVGLDDAVASGTFDADRYMQRIGEYRATVELPGVIAVEQQRETIMETSGERPKPSKANEVVAPPPRPKAACVAETAACAELDAAIERYYDKLDRRDAKLLEGWKKRLDEKSRTPSQPSQPGQRPVIAPRG